MRFAIVDLGTNSVRFSIYESRGSRQPQVLLKRKEMIQPGQGVFATGRLDTHVMNRIIKCLLEFTDLAQEHKVPRVWAYATCALREARNQTAFVKRVKKISGIQLKVISGRREAELIAKGILHEEGRLPRHFATIDIGGGSTEISFVQKGRLKASHSLKLGSARLFQLFPIYDSKGQVRPAQIVRMRLFIRQQIHLGDTQTKNRPPSLAIGTSGTMRSLNKILRRLRREPQPENRRGGFLHTELEGLIVKLQNLSLKELRRLPFLEEKRAPQILGGAILLDELLTRLQIPKVEYSESSLRDGILLDLLRQKRQAKAISRQNI